MRVGSLVNLRSGALADNGWNWRPRLTDVIEAEPGPSTYLAKSTYWDGRSTLGKSMSGSALLRGRR